MVLVDVCFVDRYEDGNGNQAVYWPIDADITCL